MKLFEITSGFIAAVLIALGAYQYVNTTTVEEEPVVKEEAKVMMQERWFLLNITSTSAPENPANQQIQTVYDEDIPDPCDDGPTICAVKLSLPTNFDETTLLGKTVDEATDEPGVDYADGEHDSYAYRTGTP